MELERGPSRGELLPLGPRVSREGLFASLAGVLVDVLGSGDAGLGTATRTIVGDGAPDMTAAYAGTVDLAEQELAQQTAAGVGGTADLLVDAGAGASAYRDSVLRYLPQPDASIEMPFLDLPTPPDGRDRPEPEPPPRKGE